MMCKFFISVLFVSFWYSASAVPVNCHTSVKSDPCPFNNQCNCTSFDGSTDVLCNIDTNFPVFSATDVQIGSVTVCGEFSVIPDNAFYLLSGLTFGQIALVNVGDDPILLTSYDTSFLTQSANGISGLNFVGFNPINLTTMTNTDSVEGLIIEYSELQTVPAAYKNFHKLNIAYLDHNEIMTVNSEDFNFARLFVINLQSNGITTVDPKFANWLKLNPINVLDLSYNPIPCDQSVQWMANYALCQPFPNQQIWLDGVDCESGGSILDYLQPFVKCS